MRVVVGGLGVACILLAGSCGTNASGRSIAVEASDTACVPEKTSLPAGKTTFAVHNTGKQVTELYVYDDGDRIVGEVENVGPGTTRSLVADLRAGHFTLACKPGQKGDGIRTEITVTA
jgi:iron uptake system component EfeO